jgi:hypothetical protein
MNEKYAILYHDYHHIQGDVIYAITILKSSIVEEVEKSWFYAYNLTKSLGLSQTDMHLFQLASTQFTDRRQ